MVELVGIGNFRRKRFVEIIESQITVLFRQLDQLAYARLRITAIRAPAGPGIEFLEYKTPRNGRPFPPGARANDLTHWQTRLVADSSERALERLFAVKASFISPGVVALPQDTLGFRKGFLVRDPDGYRVSLFVWEGKSGEGE